MNKPVFVPPKPLSNKERVGSREGTIGRFPAEDLYVPEAVEPTDENNTTKTPNSDDTASSD